MKRTEIRYHLTAALLQADGPLPLDVLLTECGVAGSRALPVLKQMVAENVVLAGNLLPGRPGPQYVWHARWAEEIDRHVADARRGVQAAVARAGPRGDLALDGPTVRAFNDYIINEYSPPKDKRFLVFFQCSVRRPFSTSPSHGSMRRAVTIATGYGPARDFQSCPVHVVVLASTVGPVPYELEDTYPANVSAGGVKHLRRERYDYVKPILAARMAQYMIAHGGNYDRISTFTDSAYADVMREAARIAGIDFPILPAAGGPRVLRMGKSKPRTYWQKCWIQLYLEIVTWLGPAQQKEAAARLKELDVEYC